MIFTKGADVSILPRLSNSAALTPELKNIISNISKKGYRTLCYAMKELPSDYTEEGLESELNMIGITGVEDELQDGVIECLRDFREAGINVWMLTGDKGETALEIGYSCGLFERDNFGVFIIDEDEEHVSDRLIEIVEKKKNCAEYGFMIAGSMLPQIFKSKEQAVLLH